MQRISSLADCLRVEAHDLDQLRHQVSDQYTEVLIKKKDGTVRQCWNPSGPLRRLQTALTTSVLRHVDYPHFLHGSIKGRDYVSNAEQHLGAKWGASIDIKNFFPSITREIVRDHLWRGFFRFSPDVADVLSDLTTLDGKVPQGSLTACHLANLMFWDQEAEIARKLEEMGFIYTRYVDDISVTSKNQPSQQAKSAIFQTIYHMIRSRGLYPNRSKEKEKVMSRLKGISITGLNVGHHLSRSSKARDGLAEDVINFPGHALSLRKREASKLLSRLEGRLTELNRFHPNEALRLRGFLKPYRQTYGQP